MPTGLKVLLENVFLFRFLLVFMGFSQYTNKKAEAALLELKTSEQGLASQEAVRRLKQFGANELKENKAHWLKVLGRQFKSPFFYLLFGAGTVALAVRELVDGCVILVFILVNVALGFLQEFRSEKAVALLRKYISATVRVRRDSQDKTINKNELVKGDIVLLEPGNIVPADLRIVKSYNLLVDESVLTGESQPAAKQSKEQEQAVSEIFLAKNILFSATAVVSGKAEAVVVATGQETAVGNIAKLAGAVSRPSFYESGLTAVSKLMMKIVAAAILFVFVVNLLIKGTENFIDFLIFCVALVVSILPEALPVVVTFALSEGSLKMAKEKVVVRRMTAIEDLGNIDILCSDKTGTLTQNKLSLKEVVASNQEQCFLYGLLTSPYIKEEIDSNLNGFDLALWQEASLSVKEQMKRFKVIHELPFDSVRMRNVVLAQDKKGEKCLVVRGAPETVLPLCSGFAFGLTKQEIAKEIEARGLAGQRILAIAAKYFHGEEASETDENNLTFIGYLSFVDPLKDTAKEAINLAKKLGVKVKIITGDSAQVAGVVAKQVGLIKRASQVENGWDLDKMTQEEFDKTCEEAFVFARVSPQTKYRIIQSLQKKYEVGFLGEGINDAPALKMANVGIAVEGASDVSREVSDLVLTQKDLRVLVRGIQRGRTIFSNINKYIKCALASNFGNFYSIAIISLFIDFLPMLPVQILLGNLLSDFPLITIATDAVDPEELKRPKQNQLKSVVPLIITLALVSTTFDFIFFAIFRHAQPAVMQTLWFLESILTEIALIFSIRTSHFFLKAKRPSWPLIALTIVDALFIIILPFTGFGQQAFHFTNPPYALVLLVLLLVTAYFFSSEAVKLIYFRFFWPWKNGNHKPKPPLIHSLAKQLAGPASSS